MSFAIPVIPGAFVIDDNHDPDTPKSELYSTEKIFGRKKDIPKNRIAATRRMGSVFVNPKKQDVELKSLTPTQETVHKSRIDKMVKEWDPSKVDRINVLHRENKHFLTNGHHRAAAAIIRGETHLPANVY